MAGIEQQKTEVIVRIHVGILFCGIFEGLVLVGVLYMITAKITVITMLCVVNQGVLNRKIKQTILCLRACVHVCVCVCLSVCLSVCQ